MGDSKRQRALVVEDDEEMRRYYARFFERLSASGFVATVVADGEKALDALTSGPMDILILDWNLPGISGEALLKAVRANPTTRSTGVLMVTGRGATEDEIAALESGADDFLSKPFDEKELLARIMSLSRRLKMDHRPQRAALCPGFEVDLTEGLVRVDGHRVRLTSKELRLLALFLDRPNHLLSNADLWAAVWGYDSEGWERTLALTISTLRRKLGPVRGACISIVQGKAYVFESPRKD